MRRSLVLFAFLGASTAVAQPLPPEPEGPPVDPEPPPAPPVVTTPPPAPPVVIAPKPEPAQPVVAPPPKRLLVGAEGLFQPGMLAQAWFVTETSGGKVQLSTFRLRRAEIHAKGEIVPKRVSYLINIDVAKVREFQDTAVATMGGDSVTVKQPVGTVGPLQDLVITFLSKAVDISIGQFKIPVSWEGVNSSAKVIMPERALASTVFGDRRDLGIKLVKTFTHWGYHAGVYNGAGANNLDTNTQKDVALRLEAYPFKGLTIAGMAYDTVGNRKRKGTKDRWEADLRLEAGPILIQAEYIQARDVKADGARAVGARGFYGALAFMITECVQPVVRIGYVDQDTSKNLDPVVDKDDELVHYDVGVNYYLKGHEMKLQGSYQRQQFETRSANNQIIVAAQVWY